MIADLLSRQSPETKLKESIDDLKETIKATYQRKVHESVHGGVMGAGKFGESFFGTLGLTGIAENIKKKAEAKEIDRQEQEKFVQDFQENSEAGQILTASTARAVAEEMYREQKKEEVNKSESEIEGEKTKQDQVEIQKTMSDDLTDLYTISDDYFKEMQKKSDDIIKILEQIRDNGGAGGGGIAGTIGDIADIASSGKKGGGKVGKAGKIAGALEKLGGLGKVAKVGGGLLAVGTAAYDAYGDYQSADEQVKSGEITKEQGQVKKGEAVGGGIGAAGGALAGAKAGAMLGAFGGPVGMAIGGLLGGAAGYVGGKWLGKKTGGSVVSASQSFSPSDMGNVDAMGNPTGMGGADTSAPSSAAKVDIAGPGNPATQDGEFSKMPVLEKTALVKQYAQQGLPGFKINEDRSIEVTDKRFLQKGAIRATIRDRSISSSAGVPDISPVSPASAGVTTAAGKPLGMELATKAAGSSPMPIAASTIPPAQGSEITRGTQGVREAETPAVITPPPVQSTTVVAPSNTTINNSTKESSKKNTDSTFQKYVDRRFYPV